MFRDIVVKFRRQTSAGQSLPLVETSGLAECNSKSWTCLSAARFYVRSVPERYRARMITIEEADDIVRFLLDEMMMAMQATDTDLVRYYMSLARSWDSIREKLFKGEHILVKPEVPARFKQ